jgi:hypothetical protein
MGTVPEQLKECEFLYHPSALDFKLGILVHS